MKELLPALNAKIVMKEPTGWFAAGESFRKAMALLSDGSFRLFAHICLEADRHTGRFSASHKELAVALGKSKRAIGAYVSELQDKGICAVRPGRNQFDPTQFEVADDYWPYQRTEAATDASEQRDYVSLVRDLFLALGCVEASFGAANEAIARDMQKRAIPLAVIDQAMLLAACRKYSSWIEGHDTEPIRSLAYFKDVIGEIQQKPLPPGYDGYLRKKVRQLAAMCGQSNVVEKSTADALVAQKSNQQNQKTPERRDDIDYQQ